MVLLKDEVYMWKQYYKNYYISDKGEVKNINTGRILKQYITHQGYYRTNIRKEECVNNW